jgi:hypothetical protein
MRDHDTMFTGTDRGESLAARATQTGKTAAVFAFAAVSAVIVFGALFFLLFFWSFLNGGGPGH